MTLSERLAEYVSAGFSGIWIQSHEPDDLRESDDLRQQVASRLSQVRSSLDELMVDRPRRRILRASARQEDR